MSRGRSIISWQPVLTDHMAYTLLEFARVANADLQAFVATREDADRKAQGWTATDLKGLDVAVLPQRGWLKFVIRVLQSRPGALHIIVSPFGDGRIAVVLLLALLNRCAVYLVSEPYSPVAAGYFDDRHRWLNSLKARLRPLLYRLYGALISRRLKGVFAISPLAVRQYMELGIDRQRVFPFGYFVPARAAVSEPHRPASSDTRNSLRLVFVGNLIRRKGVDNLAAAVRELAQEGIPVTLDVYGPGDVAMLGEASSAVRYRGRIPFGETGRAISEYDVLVLTSLHDGWGVVVNEAIQAGVPVACTVQVGASALVGHRGCGWVFDNPSVVSIKTVIRALSANRASVAAARKAAVAAASTLSPEIAGRFMYDAVRSAEEGTAPPPCPWYA